MSSIVVPISLMILTLPALVIMGYDLSVFNKSEYKVTYKSKTYLSLMFSFIVIGSLIAIFEFIMYFVDKDGEIISSILSWILAGITYALVIAVYLLIFFWSQYVIFGISESGVKIFGESVKKEKIECIICDKDTKDIYFVYTEGTRKVKKLRISSKAKFCSSILENYSVLNTKLIEDSSFQTKFKEIWNEKRGISVDLTSNDISDENK